MIIKGTQLQFGTEKAASPYPLYVSPHSNEK